MRTKQKHYYAPEAVDSTAPQRTTISALSATNRVFLFLEHVPFLRLEPETEQSQVHPNPVTAEEPVKKRRCGICKRKIGMLGFNCRCGHIFCGSHRYSEDHSCPFDYKKSGRLALATQLPLNRAEKLQRF
ncbi:Zinc finger A20 and AN1 domain-containing stress-associated protein 10 [Cardamine amara subsp. amara]|uniref:Zinc finger A20 and AN1 domain-containing stress-associated protein 10 n=1 Tax=Cardamine amara subsp. amara TaxID=228776 RepID=A0ABD1AB54_CARAN